MFVHPDNTINSIIWSKITFEGHFFDAQRVDIITKVAIIFAQLFFEMMYPLSVKRA